MATTTATRLRSAPSVGARLGRLPTAALVGGALLLIDFVVAAGVVQPRFQRLLVPLLAAAGLSLVFRFRLAAAALLLVFTDTLFYASKWSFAAGPVGLRPHELALGALLVVAIARPRRATWGGAAGGALAAFLALVTLSVYLAVAAGRTDLSTAFDWSRELGLLTLFYVVVRLFPEPAELRRVLGVAVAFAALTGVVSAIVSLSGFGGFLQDPGKQFIRAEEGLGLLDRVRLPGLSLCYALFWYAVVRRLEAPPGVRLRYGLALVGTLLAILLSFNRNMWLGLLFGLVLMLVTGGVWLRGRLTKALAIAASAVLVLALVGAGAGGGSKFSPIVARGKTLLTPGEVSRESSIRDRETETSRAWRTARAHLVTGIGPGASYGVLVVEQVGPRSFVRTPQLFLHNQYLYLLLIGGIPTLAAFLLFLGLSLRAAFAGGSPPWVRACGAGLATIMLSAFVALYFTAEDMIVPIALLAAAAVASRRAPA